MNADELLRHYERIADAPEAVGRLRRFILDLAVRGKLVAQDVGMLESSQTLNQVATIGAVRREAELAGTPPYEVPEGWKWIPFGSLHTLIRGVTYSKGDTSDGPGTGFVPVLRANNIGAVLTHDEPVFVRAERVSQNQFLRHGDYLIALSSGSKNLVGKAVFVPKDFDEAFGGFCGVIRLHDPQLRRLVGVFLRTDFYRNSLAAGSRGIGINNLKKETISSLHFPLPPLGEQHRIVAKVDELMALCDRLEAARAQREAARDRLARSCLARLDTPDPETFREDARFALDALPALTARPEQIKSLRQTVLNLAVRGKLVPQDPRDKPASELLMQIAATRHSLGIASEPTTGSREEVPFELPRGWCWSRIGGLCTKTGSGSTPRGGHTAYANAGIPFLRSQNVYDDGLRLDGVAYIDAATHARMAGTAVRARDLLLNITGGSIGRCCRVPDDFAEANISQHVAIIRAAVPGMTDFLHRLVLSPYFQSFVANEQTGAGRGGLPKNRMDRIAVAVPPLAEQHRIVTKVDELMALCDQLEASLTRADEHRRRLLEALLHDALQPCATTGAGRVTAARSPDAASH